MGIFTLFLWAGVFIALEIYLHSGAAGGANQFDGFSQSEKTATFDNLFRELLETGESPNIETFTALLDSLEKTATGSEGELSVLKRRRLLAKNFSVFLPPYFEAATRSVGRYPHSSAICAVAGEALLLMSFVDEGIDADVQTKEKYALYAKILSEAGPLAEKSFMPLAFAFYSLSDLLKTIESAQKIPHIEEIFSLALYNLNKNSEVYQKTAIDAALLKILGQKIEEAASFASPLSHSDLKDRKVREFLANWNYDFDDLNEAARLWVSVGGERDLARAADALYLAKKTENARSLWAALSGKSSIQSTNMSDNELNNSRRIKIKSLYNLASTARSSAEKAAVLKTLFASADADSGAPFIYGTVLYTRLLDDSRAAAILNENALTKTNAILDLELFRRSLSAAPHDKTIADCWFLLDRHSEDARIYHWISWYFDFQKRFAETDFLMRKAERNEVSGSWLLFNRAAEKVRAYDYKEAKEIFNQSLKTFKDYPELLTYKGDLWAFYADLGLVHEAEHNWTAALDNFLLAREHLLKEADLEAKANRTQAALLQLHLSRVLKIFGRESEARDAVLQAADYDGSNINVRVMVERLGT